MRVRSMYVAVGIVVAVVALMLTVNNFTAWNVWSEPAQQAPGEDDPSLDPITILKPEDLTGIVPTPLPSKTPPKEAIPLTPGQPWGRDFPASPENLTRIPPEATRNPNEPWINYVQLDIVPEDSSLKALRSELIVLGEVVDVQSQWSTSDSKRPANPHISGSGYYIYSLTTVKVEQVLSGEAAIGDSIRLIQNGGQVGEDQLIFDDGYPLFTPRQLVVVYVNPIIHPEMEKLVPGVVYSVVERYFVDRTTQFASNPFSQKPLNVLIEEIEQAKQIKQSIQEGRFTPPPPPKQ